MKLNKGQNWYMKHTVDTQEKISRLFFVKTSRQKILKFNYEVLLIDCIYKINTYKMSLCVINEVTAINTTFYAGFYFLINEDSEYYEWMLKIYKKFLEFMDVPDSIVFVTDSETDLLSAIPDIFPEAKQLLCFWHINKNVLSNCRSWFENNDEEWKAFYATWNTVLYAKTEESFEDAWNALQLKYQNDVVPLYYLQDLVRIYKKKIIKYFTD